MIVQVIIPVPSTAAQMSEAPAPSEGSPPKMQSLAPGELRAVVGGPIIRNGNT